MLTFVAHASSYFLRKPLGVIKHDLATHMNLSLWQLGWLDSALLFPLAICQIFAAHIGEKWGPRRVLSLALIAASGSMLVFGLFPSYWMLVVLLALNGAFQSMVVPYCIRALSLWFSGQSNSTRFGIWGTSMFVGLMLGGTLGVLSRAWFGWRHAFLLPCAVAAGVGGVVYRLLRLPSGATAHNKIAGGKRAGDLLSSAPASPARPAQQQSISEIVVHSDVGESETEIEGSDIYLIDTVHHSKTLRASEVAKIKMVKEIAFAYFCVNALRCVCVCVCMCVCVERRVVTHIHSHTYTHTHTQTHTHTTHTHTHTHNTHNIHTQVLAAHVAAHVPAGGAGPHDDQCRIHLDVV
jgi:MFS family permease